ncbi:MAG: prolyl oligopeptidase family serine peptidase [Bacteroidota bacterium]
MKFFAFVFGFCFLGMLLTLFAQEKFNPPATPKKPFNENSNGFNYTDNYRWLEDKSNPDVIEWSKKQHSFTLDFINKTYPEVTGLKNEIRDYLDRDIIGSPFFKGNREFFYAKKKGDLQYKFYTRIKNKEILIFDPSVYDPTGKSAISEVSLTRDGNKAAIAMQNKGNEINEYRIIDTKKGKQLGEIVPNGTGWSWTKDEKHAYFYVRSREMIEKQIPVKTVLHTIGDNPKNDVFLIAPKDAKDEVSIWDDENEDYTLISEGDFYSNTVKIKKIGSTEDFKIIYSSKKYKADVHLKNGKIYYMTNFEAPNFKILVASLDKPEFDKSKVFYPEKKSVLEGFVITSDYVIIQEKKELISTLAAYDSNGNFIREIPLPVFGDVGGMSYHKESNSVYVSINSFTTPSLLYKLEGKTLEWKFVYQDKPPVDTKDIESKLVYYLSKDSTKIPMFLVYKKGVKLDGTNPTILYGYGGFNISMAPGFIGTTASFINRGGVYAIACIRGGNEYGEKWHNDGMLFKKQNTFDDFISAAEFLINEKYTNTDKLVIKGGSNGGLLTGAVMVQRPDLFKAVVCAVPLLDMLRYHKFLIARYWIPEYGDPDKKEDFLNILKYSPYHNIKPGFNYPTALIKAGENDARVDPLHAKKFVAALQNNEGQTNPILLFVDFESGHGSGQSIEQQVNNIELEWRFVLGNLGVK